MQSNGKKFLAAAVVAVTSWVVSGCYAEVTGIDEPGLDAAKNTVPTVGAVNNWFDVTDGTTLSVDMTPQFGEDGYHFYSLSPFFQGASYGLYAGLQTNGNLGDGVEIGNMFIFSVFNGIEAFPEPGVTATPFGGEGIGYSLRLPFDWSVGNTYTVTIQRESFSVAYGGYLWSGSITDAGTGDSYKLGEIVAPPEAVLLSGGSAFHERYVGPAVRCRKKKSNLESAGVLFTNLNADTQANFTGTSAPNNIFAESGCANFIHYKSTSMTAASGFGITQSQFDSYSP